MKVNAGGMKNRHPKIVLIFDDEGNVSGPADILSTQATEYRTIALNNKTEIFLETIKPSVILFALSSVEKSVGVYSDLIEKGTLSYPNYSVLLCSNKESSIAFRCCIKGLFDTYFVYQPLYTIVY
jgi:hypothetical protein